MRLLVSLVPRPSQLFNVTRSFSACNIEKLGGPGDKARNFDLGAYILPGLTTR